MYKTGCLRLSRLACVQTDNSTTLRKMFSVSLLTLLLTIAPSLAIPPPGFGFPEAPNDTALSVTFQDNGNSIVVSEAELFGVNGILPSCSSLPSADRLQLSLMNLPSPSRPPDSSPSQATMAPTPSSWSIRMHRLLKTLPLDSSSTGFKPT